MEKKALKLVKKALYTYPKMLKEAVTSTVEWADSNMAVDFGKVAVQSSAGNFKETQLCKIMDDNLLKVRWCYMVEKVLDHYHFEQDKVKFIKMHYFDKRGELETCLEIGVCRATFYNWQNEVLETAYNWAKELKVI
jgi:hypothetical protein